MVTFITAIFERLSDMENLQLEQNSIEVRLLLPSEQDLEIHSGKLVETKLFQPSCTPIFPTASKK